MCFIWRNVITKVRIRLRTAAKLKRVSFVLNNVIWRLHLIAIHCMPQIVLSKKIIANLLENRFNQIVGRVRMICKLNVFVSRGIATHSLLKMSGSAILPGKRNIEIKARIGSDEEFHKRVEIAKKLTNTDGQILKQRDVFYNVSAGRLKLRMQVRIMFFCHCSICHS